VQPGRSRMNKNVIKNILEGGMGISFFEELQIGYGFFRCKNTLSRTVFQHVIPIAFLFTMKHLVFPRV
jgi:hypothetical protein